MSLRMVILSIVALAAFVTALNATTCYIKDAKCEYGLDSGTCAPGGVCYDWGTSNSCEGFEIVPPATGSTLFRWINKVHLQTNHCDGSGNGGFDCESCTEVEETTCQKEDRCRMDLYPSSQCDTVVCRIHHMVIRCTGSRGTPSEASDYCGDDI
jgi:hypothetical protein